MNKIDKITYLEDKDILFKEKAIYFEMNKKDIKRNTFLDLKRRIYINLVIHSYAGYNYSIIDVTI